jgi:hypothetical protein
MMTRERPRGDVERENRERIEKQLKRVNQRSDVARQKREMTTAQRADQELRATNFKTALPVLIQKTKPAIKSWDAHWAKTRLDAWSFFAEREFRRSKTKTAPNGTVIWLLLAIFRSFQLKQSPPKWALDALSDTGASINDYMEILPTRQIPKKLKRAIGLDQPHCFTQVQKQMRKINMGMDVRLELKERRSITEARKLIAKKYGVSIGTVRNGEKYVADFYTVQTGLDDLSVQKGPMKLAP